MIVLPLNVSLTIWLRARHGFEDGISFLFQGSYRSISGTSTALHLIINILSTLLLGASNYTMQVLSSPTRKEVDLAHARGKWLDIGIPSIKNLRSISWKRIIMVSLLGLSSIPLHLMYNSVIFTLVPAIEYSYNTETENFLNTTKPLDILPYNLYNSNVSFQYSLMWQVMKSQATNGTMKRYDVVDCIAAFATTFITKYNEVILVTNDTNTNLRVDNEVSSDIVYAGSWGLAQIPYAWICGDQYSAKTYADREPVCTVP